MYSVKDREILLEQITQYIKNRTEFEGLIQIGSGALGFADIYSDIDLMAGCYDIECVKAADSLLQCFFSDLGACHIEKRSWTSTVLGMSVYFENGLSADISFMPTNELPIRSPQWRIIFAKTDSFSATAAAAEKQFTSRSGRYGVNNSIHYRFVSELRYAEIALLRGEIIFADISLNNARQLLLAVETVTEGKKLHQFKAYNTLDSSFIDRLEETYPCSRTVNDINTAKEKLLALYLEVVNSCDGLQFDTKLLKLIGCLS